MNETQFYLFLQDTEKLKEHLSENINALYEQIRELYVAHNVLDSNCCVLVEQLRESRSTSHKLRERLKKYEPETTL